MSDINFPTCDLSPGYSPYSSPRGFASAQSSLSPSVTTSVHERLLADIRDLVVDGKTFVAFIRAYEEAVRIVREDKIPCGYLVATSLSAAREARPSRHSLPRYSTPLPLASATVDVHEAQENQLKMTGEGSEIVRHTYSPVKVGPASASVIAELFSPVEGCDLTEDPFCNTGRRAS